MFHKRLLIIAIIIYNGAIFTVSQVNGPCVGRNFGYDSVVCVCNSTYCDDIGPLELPEKSQYIVYTSSKDGLRYDKQINQLDQKTMRAKDDVITITINRNDVKQTVFGFGGAFTDAAGININALSDDTRERLIRSYFSSDGIEYTLGRVPMGGTDFSTHPYTYDDGHDGDFDLEYFSLASEDLNDKIPIIQKALQYSNRPIRLFSGVWSAPAWMKTNDDIGGKGHLKGDVGGEYYQTWAQYFVKFLDEYAKRNITFWGVSSQNEPMHGDVAFLPFNSLGYTPETLEAFVVQNLGPTLKQNGYEDIQLMTVDDQRFAFPQWPIVIIGNESSGGDLYVSGFAVHWYADQATGPGVLDQTHDLFPDKFILYTEACAGSETTGEKVQLGNWERGAIYALDIIQDLQHWVVGWTDWNLALNLTGGPNWINNTVDSPIIVNDEDDEFYKQPLYYALGHFSKFIQPGSAIVNSTSSNVTAFGERHIVAVNPDNSTVFVVVNSYDNPINIEIDDSELNSISAQVPAHSIQTYIWT